MLASYIKNKNICLIDSNSTIGAKIKVSGGAKCNITNEYVSYKNYIGDLDFIKFILKSYTNKDLLRFLNKNNLQPFINAKIVKGTYFCKSSKDVILMFKALTTHVEKYLNTKVLDIQYGDFFTLKTTSKTIKSKKLVIASGGLSFENLGASSLAFDIALKFKHTIIKTKPALVGFTVQKDQFWFKNLSGVSTKVQIKIENKIFKGGFLFTYKGCTGPSVLNASLYWKKGSVLIDFLPDVKIEKYFKSNKNISSILPLPKRFIQEFLLSKNLEDKAMSNLTTNERNILEELKSYSFCPAGTFGYTKAEVTSGGINTNEINHKSFESLKQKDLYFIGECLDITGQLGGYNFQIVFSEAFLCAKSLMN